MNTSLRGRVVIAFRSNSYCFWEIWAVPGSIPRWGTWFFFFVQIIFYLLFMNIHNIYTPNQVSKVLGNLSRITLPFWTVCAWKHEERNKHRAQVIGRLFSPSQKLKKWTQRFRQCFQLGMGILNATRKIFLVVYGPHRELQGLQGVGFQGKKYFAKMVSNFSEINFGFT